MSKKIKSNGKLRELIKLIKRHHKKADTKLVEKAFHFSKKLHREQFRASKEPYFIHPANVALMLAELGLDEKVVTAALLHDILEDTDATPKKCSELFGNEICSLIQGVTKWGLIEFKTRHKSNIANIQKMLLAAKDDLRVMILKLADRLNNMQTLQFLSGEKQKRIAADTLIVYAPLAHTLGIHAIKDELEDLSFRFLQPKKYAKLREEIKKRTTRKEKEIDKVIEVLKRDKSCKDLFKDRNRGIEFEKRSKNIYSIYCKLMSQGKALSQINDCSVLKIVTNSVEECYKALGRVHLVFKPIPNKFKDYIAIPRDNIYQSLHTQIIGPGGSIVKVYIRTKEMDKIANYGVIACMNLTSEESNNLLNKKTLWLNKMLNRPLTAKSSKTFVNLLGIDSLSSLLCVFTPDGGVMELPANASALDFVYLFDPQKAPYVKEVTVNGKPVPLWQELVSGNVVDWTISKKIMLNEKWFNFANSIYAKKQIKDFMKKNKGNGKAPRREMVQLELIAVDRVGLGGDIFESIARQKIYIDSVTATTNKKKNTATFKLTLNVYHPKRINLLMRKLEKIKGITKTKLKYLSKNK